MVHITKKGVEKISLSSLDSKQAKKKSKTKEDYLRNLNTIIRIGKSGLSESIVEEIIRQLKKNKTIKIKILKSVLGNKTKKEVFEIIEEKTKATIIKSIGFTIILTRQKNN